MGVDVAAAAASFWGRTGRATLKKYGLMISFILMSAVISVVTPGFLTGQNILNILRQSSIVGIMAIGTTFVIIGGGFDISVGSTMALCAALTLGLQSQMHWAAASAAAVAAGAAVGLMNGVLSAKFRIVPIITTLGTMTIVRGLTYLYTKGYPIVGQSEAFKWIGSGYLLGFPFPIIALVALVALCQFVLSETRLGRYVCAVGGNKEASRLSGIPVDFYLISTFVIGGVMAALSGIVYASRLNSVTPLAGNGYELDAIASAVIGGTSVSGGEGTVVGTLVGVLLMTIINNMFNLLGVQVYVQYLIKGVIILLVVGVDSYSKRPR